MTDPLVVRLSIDASMFERLPGLRVAVTSAVLADEGIGESAAIDAHWSSAWAGFRARGLVSATAHAHVAAYRAALRGAGIRVSDFPPAIESLTRRALKQPEPFHIHPIVDFYNGVCLNHVVPSGAIDVDAVMAVAEPSLSLRSATAQDRFTPMGSKTSEPMTVGELAWFSGPVALSRHILWRQSDDGLVRPGTRRLMFISEFVEGISDAAAQDAAGALLGGAQRLLGARCTQVMLNQAHSQTEVIVPA